jgi:3-methyladenine DNA glycosylase AlkC
MPEPLKTIFFTRAFFDDLTAALTAAYPPFDGENFLLSIFDEQWESRELKDRLRHSTLMLHDAMPANYRTAMEILCPVSVQMSGYGFDRLIFPDYVELYGLDDWDISLPALALFTTQISSEFAVRPFIVRDQARMMAQMLDWSHSDDPRVRRLSTEGCRPRLPWAIALPALKADPAPILPILETLKNDPDESVRRSVSNNLNDIAKDNPAVVIDVVQRWQAESDSPEMRAIINHALRTLIKQAHPDALALIGYSGASGFAIKNLTVTPSEIPQGGEITFSFEIESLSDEPQNLMIDYIAHLMRANGSLTPKVFKLTKRVLNPGETIMLTRRHSFKNVTTRKYYPGLHALQIQINGALSERCEFMVKNLE